VVHVRGAVFGCHAGHEAALDDDVQLGGAGVDVGCVEAAGADEAEGNGAAGAYEGGEGVAVCFYSLATCMVMLVWEMISVGGEAARGGTYVFTCLCLVRRLQWRY
jgi:hypothetical protein